MGKKISKELKDKLKKKRNELGASSKKKDILFVEEGTIRVRVLKTKQNEIAAEVSHIFMSKGDVYSASTLGEPCYAMEKYNELKKSKDDEDQELASKIYPKKVYLLPVVVYEDGKGKKIDKEKSGKLLKITKGVYESIIDLYLDSEWGDMTDPKEGFDIKITRKGKGKTDTEYTLAPCQPTPLDKEWAKKEIDLDKAIRTLFEPYDVVKEKIDSFLGLDDDDDKKKDKKSKGKDKDKKGKDKSSKGKKDDFKAPKKEEKKLPKKEDKKSDKGKDKKKDKKSKK